MNPFRRLLDSRHVKAPVGTWIMSVSPLVAEGMGHAGFDWGVIDMEHTPVDLMSLVHLLQAVGNTQMVPVVRVPWNDAVMVKRVLDAGAQTLLFPFIQNAEEARQAVAATRYPPLGVRGMAAMGRASAFGTRPDYFQTASQHTAVVVQLESEVAIANLEAIAAVPGVDALFVGPADLSGSMGLVGQISHPDVMALMASAAGRARALGCAIGTVGGTAELVGRYRDCGFDYLAIASDLGLMMRAAQSAVQALSSQVTAGVASSAPGSSASPTPGAASGY